MIAVIFEVEPGAAGRQTYIDIATALRTELETMDGFISIERFESLAQPGKILSLSFWRDEAAIAHWRQRNSHRNAQATGRAGVFVDYRLRVAAVLRDYSLNQRDEAPCDSLQAHDTPTSPHCARAQLN